MSLSKIRDCDAVSLLKKIGIYRRSCFGVEMMDVVQIDYLAN